MGQTGLLPLAALEQSQWSEREHRLRLNAAVRHLVNERLVFGLNEEPREYHI